jgi:DNA repair ATPase RecN
MTDYKKQLQTLKDSNQQYQNFEKNLIKWQQNSGRLENLYNNLDKKGDNIIDLEKQLSEAINTTNKINKKVDYINKKTHEIDDFLNNIQKHSKEIEKIKNDLMIMEKIKKDTQNLTIILEDVKNKSKQHEEKTEFFLEKVFLGENIQKEITKQIKKFEEKSLGLDEKYQALEYFNKKFEEFDLAVYDIEERTKTIKNLKKEIVNEKEGLKNIKEGFNEQIRIILKLFQNFKNNDNKTISELREKLPSLISTLHSIGWSDKEIAQQLNMELSEVKLILKKYSYLK